MIGQRLEPGKDLPVRSGNSNLAAEEVTTSLDCAVRVDWAPWSTIATGGKG